ncbi:hypothetical protein N657DRAFT_578341 [Parathielavia appendiculata]|uniref:Uncharacterized protein n=1 Tax=Parathielavia appendiculata TaxID=2587402 RepID=A0AAN6TV84_9PEZI|nr:hypothetical protein N657DRAFT_578341 [Parathielavia appendiculata]
MSSRFTSPISKLTRSFSTTPAVARPSHLLNKTSKVATAVRKPNAVAEEAPSQRNHSSTTTTTPHRPLPTTQGPSKTIPFMQTFHHSAPKPSPTTYATIDRAVLPDLSSSSSSSESAQYDPYLHIRVPLLPDSTAASHRHNQPEAADAPLPPPEILVVASNPEQVLPSALTEVEGMGVDGVELGFVHLLGSQEEGGEGESFEMGRGMIRDLWRGLKEDVFGAGSSNGTSGGKAAV